MNWTVNWFPQFPISLSAPRHPTQPLSLCLYPPFSKFSLGDENWDLLIFSIRLCNSCFDSGFYLFGVFLACHNKTQTHLSFSFSRRPSFRFCLFPSSLFIKNTIILYYSPFVSLFLLFLLFVKFSSLCVSSCSPNWQFCFLIPYLIQTKVPPSTTPLSIMQEIKVRFWFWSPWNSSWDSFDGFTFVYSLSEVSPFVVSEIKKKALLSQRFALSCFLYKNLARLYWFLGNLLVQSVM